MARLRPVVDWTSVTPLRDPAILSALLPALYTLSAPTRAALACLMPQ